VKSSTIFKASSRALRIGHGNAGTPHIRALQRAEKITLFFTGQHALHLSSLIYAQFLTLEWKMSSSGCYYTHLNSTSQSFKSK